MFNMEKSFHSWVMESQEIFPQETRHEAYTLLYNGFEQLLDPSEMEYKLETIKYLNRIKSNIQKELNDKSNFEGESLFEEIKLAIIFNNNECLFYLIYTLTERIADLLISHNLKSMLDERIKNQHTLEQILKNPKENYGLAEKLACLEKIKRKRKTTTDYELFIYFITLLQRIRNKFMFHRLYVDDYSSVFHKKQIKEEILLTRIINPISNELERLNEKLKSVGISKSVLINNQNFLGNLKIFYAKNKSSKKVFVYNRMVQDDLSKTFSLISTAIIHFLGKDDLNLFEDNS